MTPLEYFAGVLDVSGSLIVTQRKDRNNGPIVILMIQNDDRRLPEMFAKRWGGKVTESSLKSDRARFSWSKRGKAAQEVLNELLPFVSIRVNEFLRLLNVNIRSRGGRRFKPIQSIGSELLGSISKL